ncbi:MAG: TIGR02996 domain-containing protein [Planctomycetia bacterium]|nr:TIGR02996 domain-containing protein [Planctomycetia bacterium]
MTDEQNLLAALGVNPSDQLGWLALADLLEEVGQSDRAELTRLSCSLRGNLNRRLRLSMEKRLSALLKAGVEPCFPQQVNSLGMRFALIPSGSFRMGSHTVERERSFHEYYHRVEITRSFYLGIFPVTQAHYHSVMGFNPSFFCSSGRGASVVASLDTRNHPVEDVSWTQAVEFCVKLAGLPAERRAKRNYRLPTEAEWEYACRASTTMPFGFGRSLSAREANFDGTQPYGRARRGAYLSRTVPVGNYKPNAWGLYDMHGNVWEWCQDWYGTESPGPEPILDPQGPDTGSLKVLRGGSCYSSGNYCRSACRFHCVPDRIAYRCRGLRVVLDYGNAATRR